MRNSANHRSIPSLTVIGRRARLTLIAFLAIGVSLAVLPLIGGPQAAVRKVSRLASQVVEALKTQASPKNLASRGAMMHDSQGGQAQQSGFTPSASITVNTLTDENGTGANCSLREAITAANTDAAFGGCSAGSGTDTITFSVTGTITLNSSLPDITTSMNITGPGASSLTISGNDSVRIMTVNSSLTMTISNLTMAHGKALNLQGGAIDSNNNTISLTNMVFDHNFATFDGGAVRNNGGNMTVTNCTFTNNEATEPFGQGGGLKANGGTTVVTGSTFLNNIAEAGGGFHVGNSSTSATVTNSTFYGNTATFGGAVETRNAGTFQNCTMSGNIASGVGGIHLLAGSVTLINTIVSGNLDPLGNPLDIDIGGTGTINLAGSFNNLIGTPGASGLTDGTNGNHVNVTNPLLAPLANYGGTTQTMPPLGNSLAINAGRNTGAPATDQRGVTRPAGGTVEIGAVEVNFIVNSNGDAVDSNIGNGTCATAGAVCTLRAAIQEVNVSAIDNYITFSLASPATIVLGSALPAITSNAGIAGPGPSSLTISGNNSIRPFSINSGASVVISGLTIADGSVITAQGGAINNTGNLSLINCTINHSTAQGSGGSGGGLYSSGNLTISNSTFSNNTANDSGGALFWDGDTGTTATVTGTTFSGNSASDAGALFVNASARPITIINSTFGGNSAAFGGAMEIHSTTTIMNSTLSNNTATTGAHGGNGGGIEIVAGPVVLTNTIVSGNTFDGNANDLAGAAASASSSFNIIGTGGGLTNGVNSNHVGVNNPQLAPLGNYGGLTQTFALPAGNVAIDGGTSTGAPTTDQRGVARPSGSSVDIGAYESDITVTPSSIPAGTVGVNYNGSSFSASGETSDFTFSETGTLPNGMFFSTVGANLDGVPTQGGSFPICILATDTTFGNAGVACYTLVINAPVLDHFAISTITSPKTAGTAFTITITAQDSSNATIVGFTGTVNLTTNAGTITPTTSGAFSAGVRNESVTVTQSGTGKTISVDDGSGHTGTSNTFTVNPGVLNHFGFGNVATQTAGTAFNISLTAQDLNNNTVTSFSGSVTITTVTGGSISPTTSGAFTSGTRTQSVTLTQGGTGKTITVTDGIGHNGLSNSFTVNAGALHHIAIGTVTSPEIAGTPFGLSLTAQDVNNNTVTSFTGTVALSTTAGTITPTTSNAFTAGFLSQAVTVTQAGGGKTISIDDGGGHTATSNAFTVNSGALFQFAISPITTQAAGTAFNITMTAQDTNGNTVTSFASTVNLSTTAGTITPTTSGAFTSGTRTQSVTVTQAGAGKTIGVTDGSGHNGTSNTFTVNAGALHHFVIGAVSTQIAGTPFNLAVTAQDLNNNTATSFTGTVGLTTTAGSITPTTSSAFTAGTLNQTVTVTQSGTGKTISVDDGGGHTATSNTFTVNPGAINHFGFGNITTQTAGVAFNITMTAQDLNNNTVTSFASTVTLSASGGSIAPTTSGAFTSGVRTESVTMTPASASRTITATDGGGNTGTSNTFAVNDTTPTIVILNPTSAQLNSTGGTVTITGTNFSASSTVQYSGSAHASTFVNATTITFVLAAADTNAAGSKTVNVTNPGPGGGTTASLLFDIDDPSVCGSQSVTVAPGNSGMASVRPGGCTSNGVDATLNRNAGAGSNATVYAAAYSSNPTGTSIFNVGGGFVDVKVTTAVGSDSVNAVYYYPNTITGANETNLKLFFFNVDHWQAVKSSGGVDPVKNTTDNQNSTTSGGTFTVTFDGTSTPTVTQLTGTVFTPSTVSTPTAVDFDSATVTRVGKSALVQWKTGMEVNNLGFNVYRQDGGDRAQVNPSLIAGTALMVGGDVRVESGYTYNWIDDNATSGASYWIEDIDLSGNSTWHGPFGVTSSSNKMITRTRSMLLNNINNSVARQANSIIQREYPSEGGNSIISETTSSVTNGRTPTKPGAVSAAMLKQWQIASRPAVKIGINKTGWYKVNASDLFAAGLVNNSGPSGLRMYIGGVEIPIKVSSNDGLHLDSVEFYGVALDTPTSNTQVYWLTSDLGSGKRINVEVASGSTSGKVSTSFQYTVERKDRTLYFSSLKNGDAENWFGPVVSSNAVSQTINVHNHDANASGLAQVEVALQGVTANSHSVNVMLNGQAINTMTFDAMDHSVMKVVIPESSLTEGNNQITFAAQNGGDVSLVDYVRITYAHSYVAENNSLSASISGLPINVSGFTSNQITAIDVANPNQPVQVEGTIDGDAGNYSLSIAAAKRRNLVMFTPDQTLQPMSITGNQLSNLSNTSNGADFVIITSKDFAPSVQPLADLRRSQGYQVSVVDVDNVYDEFNYGVHSPYAVRDFLNWTYTHWAKQPQFVMLAGSGTIDPRNYTGLGFMDFVPTKLIDTDSMETASDDWFVDFNQDGKPQMSIGRLPVHTAAEATLVVNKIIAYEHSDKTEGVVLVSDINDGIDFNSANNQIRALIPSNLAVVNINRDQTQTDAKGVLMDQLTRGGRIINYAGHGSVNLWRGNLLTDDDMTTLANHKTSPLVVTMTCLNGYFQDPKLASLGESLLKVNNGGAVSVWASSGMTDAQSQTTMNQEFFRRLFGNPTITIGQAIKAAKSATDDNDIRRTWILFGDPTMKLK